MFLCGVSFRAVSNYFSLAWLEAPEGNEKCFNRLDCNVRNNASRYNWQILLMHFVDVLNGITGACSISKLKLASSVEQLYFAQTVSF